MAAGSHVGDHPCHEVLVAVGDDDFLNRIGGFLARPGGVPRGTVAVQAGARGRDPIAKPLAGVGEVAVPGLEDELAERVEAKLATATL